MSRRPRVSSTLATSGARQSALPPPRSRSGGSGSITATYPRALDELAPIYLKTVPLDPFADRPPTYVRQGVGFELRADLPARYRGPMGEWTLPR